MTKRGTLPVGLDARHVDPVTGDYMGQSAESGPNVVIGKTMLMHRKLHRLVAEAGLCTFESSSS